MHTDKASNNNKYTKLRCNEESVREKFKRERQRVSCCPTFGIFISKVIRLFFHRRFFFVSTNLHIGKIMFNKQIEKLREKKYCIQWYNILQYFFVCISLKTLLLLVTRYSYYVLSDIWIINLLQNFRFEIRDACRFRLLFKYKRKELAKLTGKVSRFNLLF